MRMRSNQAASNANRSNSGFSSTRVQDFAHSQPTFAVPPPSLIPVAFPPLWGSPYDASQGIAHPNMLPYPPRPMAQFDARMMIPGLPPVLPLPPPPSSRAQHIGKHNHGVIKKKLNVDAPKYVPQEVQNLFKTSALSVYRCGDEPKQHAEGEPLNEEDFRIPSLPKRREKLSTWSERALWKSMLIVEEQRRKEMRQVFDGEIILSVMYSESYMISNANRRGVTDVGTYYFLATVQLPGILEKRPELSFDDSVFLRMVDDPFTEYEGRVVFMTGPEVTLRLPRTFDHANGIPPTKCRFFIRFSLDSTPFSYMYRALEKTPPPDLDELPLDKEEFTSETVAIGEPLFAWANQMLNEEQHDAVRRIVLQKPVGGLPFIVFGPPGTGKTMVVVEAVMQLLVQGRGTRVLVCTPSDAACDVFTSRLLRSKKFEPGQVLRVNSYKRRREDVIDVKTLDPSCVRHPIHQLLFRLPSKEETQRATVLVATCTMVGTLIARNLVERGEFSHIVIDESSQAMEPETLIPFSLAMKNRTNIVLVGDPFQLGPSVVSPEAMSSGLDTSFQERLMNARNLPYSKRDPRFISYLTKNYRAHRVLLSIPNALFYQGMLTANGDPEVTNSLCGWEALPNPDFPLLFIGVNGKDKHDLDQPNFRNEQEAGIIVNQIEAMLNTKSLGLTPLDIGVVSLFRSQVVLIRGLLRARELAAIRVGTIDDVQGQELKVVLISTVLSDLKWLSVKESHPVLGFLKGFFNNKKRFNVAMTRAQALTIVVGSPQFLSCFQAWNTVLEECLRNHSYQGEPYQQERSAKASSSEESVEIPDVDDDDDNAAFDEITERLMTAVVNEVYA